MKVKICFMLLAIMFSEASFAKLDCTFRLPFKIKCKFVKKEKKDPWTQDAYDESLDVANNRQVPADSQLGIVADKSTSPSVDQSAISAYSLQVSPDKQAVNSISPVVEDGVISFNSCAEALNSPDLSITEKIKVGSFEGCKTEIEQQELKDPMELGQLKAAE